MVAETRETQGAQKGQSLSFWGIVISHLTSTKKSADLEISRLLIVSTNPVRGTHWATGGKHLWSSLPPGGGVRLVGGEGARPSNTSRRDRHNDCNT